MVDHALDMDDGAVDVVCGAGGNTRDEGGRVFTSPVGMGRCWEAFPREVVRDSEFRSTDAGFTVDGLEYARDEEEVVPGSRAKPLLLQSAIALPYARKWGT